MERLMRTPLSLQIRNLPVILSPNSGLTHVLLEAADTLEHHDDEIYRLNRKLEAETIRYENLYKSRQQLIKDFKLTLGIFAVIFCGIVIYYVIG